MSIETQIKNLTHACGFDLVGIACTTDQTLPGSVERLEHWLDSGYGATMDYLKKHKPLKENPNLFLQGAKSVVMVGMLYDGSPCEKNNSQGTHPLKISNYAQGPDYHVILMARLTTLLAGLNELEQFNNINSRAFVDKEPVMERYWAWRAGLGWIGKNACLINRKSGSYFFLGGFMTTLDLVADTPYTDHCGRCTKCIDACPTSAIVKPGVVDARLCIAYHTVENKGVVPKNLATGFDGWVIGCDICQQVCPWNDPLTPAPTTWPINSVASAHFEQMIQWTQAEYKNKVQGLAIERLKYTMFRRNLYITILSSSLSAQDKQMYIDLLKDVRHLVN